jgi:hypothetical protein
MYVCMWCWRARSCCKRCVVVVHGTISGMATSWLHIIFKNLSTGDGNTQLAPHPRVDTGRSRNLRTGTLYVTIGNRVHRCIRYLDDPNFPILLHTRLCFIHRTPQPLNQGAKFSAKRSWLRCHRVQFGQRTQHLHDETNCLINFLWSDKVTNSAGRWIYKGQSVCRKLSWFLWKCLFTRTSWNFLNLSFLFTIWLWVCEANRVV